MRISTRDWHNYVSRLSKLNKTAADKMISYVQENGFEDTDAMLGYAYALATKYGEGSAELSCEMYDAIARLSHVSVPAAEPAPTATFEETASAVMGTIGKSKLPQSVGNTVGRLVKQAGADTTLRNARRDGAQFAWIPNGNTCAFCLTLASRGWQYMSRNALSGGHAEHIHANCDCEYAIRFDSNSGVAGYNPDKYLERYQNASDGGSKDKINALRRENYAEHKDEINAQKRAAYHQRTGDQSAETHAKAVEMWNKTEELDLPRAEKEHVYEELDNNLTIEEKQSPLVNRAIGNYHYYAVNKGHNEYKIYQKEPIEQYDDIINEVLSEMFGSDWEEQWKETQK